MPFSHLPGGLKPPTRHSRSSDGAPPLPCGGGFTVNPSTLSVNGFTVKGSSPQLTPSGMAALISPLECVVTKNAPLSALESVLTKTKDLNSPGMNTYKKTPVGTPSLPPFACDVFVCLFALNSEVAGLLRCRPWAWVRGSDYQVLPATARKKQHAAAWGILSHAAPRVAEKRPGGTDFRLSLASNGKGRSREKCGSRCEL